VTKVPVPVGSEVVVRPLGGKRGVVVSHRGRGRYLVQVEGVAVSCREEDLAAPPPARKARRRSQPPPLRPGPGPVDEAAPPARVDLHGLRVEEALARTIGVINDALLRGADRLEILHGKGSGRIRDAIHRQLATMTVVAAFRLDPQNPGVTWVYF
jgi:DNA mismatch repair protein MutS2